MDPCVDIRWLQAHVVQLAKSVYNVWSIIATAEHMTDYADIGRNSLNDNFYLLDELLIKPESAIDDTTVSATNTQDK